MKVFFLLLLSLCAMPLLAADSWTDPRTEIAWQTARFLHV